MSAIGKFVVRALLGIGTALLGGFVFARMWNWFVVPRFGGPLLSTIDGVGLQLVGGMFVVHIAIYLAMQDVKKKDPDDTFTNVVGPSLMCTLMYLFVWLTAWGWQHAL